MRSALRVLCLVAPLALAACAGQTVDAPWLTYPGVDGHARFLPLRGTSHDPLNTANVQRPSCGSCHVSENTFTQVTCTYQCHDKAITDQIHTYTTGAKAGTLLANYLWTPPASTSPPVAWQRPACLTCHPQGGVPDSSHHAFFPLAPDAAPHSRVSMSVAIAANGSYCKVCHGDPLDKANLATLTCVTCHTSTAVKAPLPGNHLNLLVTDAYPLSISPADSKHCLRCHDGGQVDRVAQHGSKPGPAGFGRAGPWDSDPARCPTSSDKHGCPNQPVNCFKCHDGSPPVFGGALPGLPSRPWAQDWKIPATTANQTAATACRGCHGVKN